MAKKKIIKVSSKSVIQTRIVSSIVINKEKKFNKQFSRHSQVMHAENALKKSGL